MNKFFVLLFFITLLTIMYLATTTNTQLAVVQSMWDKANHFAAFFTLYILLSLAFKDLAIAYKISLLLGFGMLIEIVQYFIPGREFSFLDVVADSIGIFIGIMFYQLQGYYKIYKLN